MPMVERLERRQLLTAYYVDPSASGANTGLTPADAWTTVAPVNSKSFQAGDAILLRSGATINGSLTFGADDAGTATTPISVGTFDPANGQQSTSAAAATLAAGNATGISALNTAGFDITNLIIAGSGQAANSFNGISFNNALANNVQLPHVHIDDVEVFGFGKFGISIGGSNGKSGFADIRITNSNIHNNTVGGIETHGVFSSSATTYANSSVYVGHDSVHDNPGYAGSSTHVGDGIVLSDVNGGTIERCESFNNGALNTHVGGPVGIWAWDSNAIVIQNNESHHNHTNSTADGGGFDLDGGCTNSIVQYNYSHDNDGPGYGLFQFSGARAWSGNVVRYNISENDGRRNSYAGIQLWNGGSGIANTEIYSNTIYVAPSNSGTPMAINVQTTVSNVHIRNNIFQTNGGLPILDIEGRQSSLSFQGNDHWSSGYAFGVTTSGTTYSSLNSWRSATAQETLSGQPVGYSVNPLLASPGSGGTIGNADLLESRLESYRLQSASPLIDAGLNLWNLFAIAPGPRDFYGDVLPKDAAGMSAWRYDIGADDLTFIVVSGSAQNDLIYLRRQGGNLNEWINAPQPGQGTPTHVDSLAGAISISIRGGGGSDTVIFDQSSGNIFATPTTLTDAGGSIALTVVGTANADSMAIDGAAKTITFNSATLSFSDVGAIEYWDASENDTIQTTGPIPVTLDASSTDDITVNGGNVIINIIQPGGPYVPPAGSGALSVTIGSRQHAAYHRHQQKQHDGGGEGDQGGDAKKLEQRAGRLLVEEAEDPAGDVVG